MGCPVIHSEIGTIDGVRSRRFSSDLFGWEVDVDGAGYGPVRAGAVEGVPGGMVQTPAEDDLAARVEPVRERGTS